MKVPPAADGSAGTGALSTPRARHTAVVPDERVLLLERIGDGLWLVARSRCGGGPHRAERVRAPTTAVGFTTKRACAASSP